MRSFVDQFGKRQAEGGFETGDAERAAFELLHLLAAGMRRVIGGDGVDDTADNAFDDRIGIVLAAQRRLHFVIAVVGFELADR